MDRNRGSSPCLRPPACSVLYYARLLSFFPPGRDAAAAVPKPLLLGDGHDGAEEDEENAGSSIEEACAIVLLSISLREEAQII